MIFLGLAKDCFYSWEIHWKYGESIGIFFFEDLLVKSKCSESDFPLLYHSDCRRLQRQELLQWFPSSAVHRVMGSQGVLCGVLAMGKSLKIWCWFSTFFQSFSVQWTHKKPAIPACAYRAVCVGKSRPLKPKSPRRRRDDLRSDRGGWPPWTGSFTELQCGAPQWCERWFINPMNTIVISMINHSYWGYKPTYLSWGPHITMENHYVKKWQTLDQYGNFPQLY